MRKVSLVVQVVGHADVPLLPKKDPDAIKWYHKVSLLTVRIFESWYTLLVL